MSRNSGAADVPSLEAHSAFWLEECYGQNGELGSELETPAGRAEMASSLFHRARSCLSGAEPRTGRSHEARRPHSCCPSCGGSGVWREHCSYSVLTQYWF